LFSVFLKITNVSAVSIFQQKKPKQFNYSFRLEKENSKENDSIETKWNDLRTHSKLKKGGAFTLPKLIIMLIMVLILLYVLRNYEI